MKRSLSILCTGLLLLTACSSPPAESADRASQSPTNEIVLVPVSTSCDTLIGADGGLVSKAALFIGDVEELNAEKRREAKSISDELGEVARTAKPELKEPLAGMREPLDEFVQASDTWTLDAVEFKAAGNSVIDICSGVHTTSTSAATPTQASTKSGLVYELSCSIDTANQTKFTDYKAAWSQPFDLCYPTNASGTPSAAEKDASSSEDPTGAKYLYGLCAETAGHYLDGTVSSVQAEEIRRALTLCPDHPMRTQLETNAAAGLALEADRANGKLVGSGKYLVGKTAQPGTWQSQGEKVEDCYWEISDAQGNIIENNFISVAPQFSIYIPPTAAGFTVNGCGFRWIGE